MPETEPARETLSRKKIFVQYGHGNIIPPIVFKDEFNAAYVYIGVKTKGPEEPLLRAALARPDVVFTGGNSPRSTYDSTTNKISYPVSNCITLGAHTQQLPINYYNGERNLKK